MPLPASASGEERDGMHTISSFPQFGEMVEEGERQLKASALKVWVNARRLKKTLTKLSNFFTVIFELLPNFRRSYNSESNIPSSFFRINGCHRIG